MSQCSGKGVFFLFAECSVLLCRKPSGVYVQASFFPPMYLDKYGEEDIGFRRGKPLYLDEGRLEQLRQTWLNHKIDEEVVRQGSKSYEL